MAVIICVLAIVAIVSGAINIHHNRWNKFVGPAPWAPPDAGQSWAEETATISRRTGAAGA